MTSWRAELKVCLDATERCRFRHAKPGISDVFDRIGRSLDIWDFEQKADSAATALASAVIESNGRSATYPAPVSELLRRRGESKVKQDELDRNVHEPREEGRAGRSGGSPTAAPVQVPGRA